MEDTGRRVRALLARVLITAPVFFSRLGPCSTTSLSVFGLVVCASKAKRWNRMDIVACEQEDMMGRQLPNFVGYCIVDIAWLGPEGVVIIQLDPFDGEAIGIFRASRGLYLGDDLANPKKTMRCALFEVGNSRRAHGLAQIEGQLPTWIAGQLHMTRPTAVRSPYREINKNFLI